MFYWFTHWFIIMKNTFGSQPVESNSWKRWLKEAVHLSGKNLALNVALVLLTIGLLAPFSPMLLLITAPALVGVFVLVAHSAASSEPVLDTLKSAPAGILRVLFCSTAAVSIMAIAFFFILMIVKGTALGSPATTSTYVPQDYQFSDFLVGSKALFAIGLWLLVILPWFAVPLMVCTNLPLRLCLDHTFKAFNQNKFVVFVVFFTALGLMGGALFHGLTVVPLFPILGGLMYSAYRHIFMGLPPLETAEAKSKSSIFDRLLQPK